MTDWQINHLLGEPEQLEQASFDEVFAHAWKLRGYSEDEVAQIWQWSQVDKLSDDEVWKKIEESGFAR